jgi:hypothetical protein
MQGHSCRVLTGLAFASLAITCGYRADDDLQQAIGSGSGGSGVPDASVGSDAGSGAPDASIGFDAGSGAPDAGSGAPDAGSGAPDASVPPPDACTEFFPRFYSPCPSLVDLGDADQVNLPDPEMMGDQFADPPSIGTYAGINCAADSASGVIVESTASTFARFEFDSCVSGFDRQGTITVRDLRTNEVDTFSIADREAPNADLQTAISTSNHIAADPDIGSRVQITSRDRFGFPQRFALIDGAVGASRAQLQRLSLGRAETLFDNSKPTFAHLQAGDARPRISQPHLTLPDADLNAASSPNRVRGDGVQRIAFANNAKPTKVEAVCTANSIADGKFVWTNAHCIMNMRGARPFRPFATAIRNYILQSSYWVVPGQTLPAPRGEAPNTLPWNWGQAPTLMGDQTMAGAPRRQYQGASLLMSGGEPEEDYAVLRIPDEGKLDGVNVHTAAFAAGYFTTQGNTRVQIYQHPDGMPQQFGDRAAVPTSAVIAVRVTNGGMNYTAVPTVHFDGGRRTTTGTDAAATAVVEGQRVVRINLTNVGSGYTDRPTIRFTGGGTGTGATAVVDFRSGNGVAGVTVTAGGAGYTSAPAVGFADGGGSGAAATAAISGGAVTSITITNPGTGYTSAPRVTFTGGGATTAATATAIFGSSYATFLTPGYEPKTPTGGDNPDANPRRQSNFAWYPVDTMGGSSGSQVLGVTGATAGKLVCLHHAGTDAAGINECVRADIILADRGFGRDPVNFMLTWRDGGGKLGPEHPANATSTVTVQQAMAGHL